MSQGAVISLVVLSGGVDVAGAVQKGKDPVIALVGAFVVGVFLLALSESGADELATLFGVAYMITSLTANGKFLLDPVTKLTGGS